MRRRNLSAKLPPSRRSTATMTLGCGSERSVFMISHTRLHSVFNCLSPLRLTNEKLPHPKGRHQSEFNSAYERYCKRETAPPPPPCSYLLQHACCNQGWIIKHAPMPRPSSTSRETPLPASTFASMTYCPPQAGEPKI